jgi:hypothetical protein
MRLYKEGQKRIFAELRRLFIQSDIRFIHSAFINNKNNKINEKEWSLRGAYNKS